MKKDGRHYDRKTKAALRILAAQRIRDGEPVKAVMESLGLCRTTFYKWLPRISDDRDIAESLAMRKGGGRPGKLTPEQKQQVFQWVNGKNPFQYGFDFGLWTRQIIRELILQKFSITLGISSVGKLLAELGLTAQKPLERAYQRNPEAIEAWKLDVYPALAQPSTGGKSRYLFLG